MLAVLLSAGLLAVSTGCGALLERDYTQVTDHVDQTADTGRRHRPPGGGLR